MSRSSRATAWRNTRKAQSDNKICVEEKVYIGSKRCFSLVETGKPRKKLSRVMHEYGLGGVDDCHNQGNDDAICRIKRIVSKKEAVKQQEVEGDDAIAIQTNGNEIPDLTVPEDQELMEPLGSSIPQGGDDFLGQQEETPPTGVDSVAGGGGNRDWIQAFAQDLLVYSHNSVEEKEEGVDLLANHFHQDKWVRGWERAPTDQKPNS